MKTRSKLLGLLMTLLLLNFSFGAGAAIDVAKQQFNAVLNGKLPEAILQSKELIAVNDGSVPPYIIYDEAGNMTGATIDLFNAVGEILGVNIKHEKTIGVSGILMGVQTGRYNLAIGPIGDDLGRQKNNDFIDYASSYPAFAVKRGNPLAINSMSDTCGKRIAVTVGDNRMVQINNYSETCVKEGKAPVEVLTFPDQPAAVLALRSDRADAFAAGIAMLSYFVGEAKEQLELAGTRKKGDTPSRYYAAVIAKDSALGPVILAAMQELFNNGTYAAIMQKWNLETSMLAEPGINLAK